MQPAGRINQLDIWRKDGLLSIDLSSTDRMAKALLIYTGAALAEIAGCFAFWVWLRSGKSAVWVLPGIVSLVAFAWLLT
jgi:hypothetical protein